MKKFIFLILLAFTSILARANDPVPQPPVLDPVCGCFSLSLSTGPTYGMQGAFNPLLTAPTISSDVGNQITSTVNIDVPETPFWGTDGFGTFAASLGATTGVMFRQAQEMAKQNMFGNTVAVMLGLMGPGGQAASIGAQIAQAIEGSSVPATEIATSATEIGSKMGPLLPGAGDLAFGEADFVMGASGTNKLPLLKIFQNTIGGGKGMRLVQVMDSIGGYTTHGGPTEMANYLMDNLEPGARIRFNLDTLGGFDSGEIWNNKTDIGSRFTSLELQHIREGWGKTFGYFNVSFYRAGQVVGRPW